MVIYLVHILLYVSSHQIKKMTSSLILLISVLLQMGFTQPSMSPYQRWALTSPFHPCHFWRLFSVALSLRSPSLDVIQHHCSVEPGLSSYATFRYCYTRPFNLLFLYCTLNLIKSQIICSQVLELNWCTLNRINLYFSHY